MATAPVSTTPEPHELLGAELGLLEAEQRALTRAVTDLCFTVYRHRPDVIAEDVALLREAKRDAGRARQVVEGLTRRLRSEVESR